MTLLRLDPDCIRVCTAAVTSNEGYPAWTQAAQSLTVDTALAAIGVLLIGMAQP